jgi:hypothetical protein
MGTFAMVGSATRWDTELTFPVPGVEAGTVTRDVIEFPEKGELRGGTGTDGVLFFVDSSGVSSVLEDWAGIVTDCWATPELASRATDRPTKMQAIGWIERGVFISGRTE